MYDVAAVERAKEQFHALNDAVVETCYVATRRGCPEATYAVCWSGDENNSIRFNDVIWYRTINIMTGEIVSEGCTLDREEYGCLIEAFRENYNPDYIKHDAIVLSCEFARDAESYMHEGKSIMPVHVVFGQSVFYQSLDQLTVKVGNEEHCIS